MDDEAVRQVMTEPAEHRVRLHGKPGPPPWQRRSRWFPHIDAGDALVMSSVLLVVLLGGCMMGVLASATDRSGTRYQTFLIIAVESGFQAAKFEWRQPESNSGQGVGSFICGTRTLRRGWFGPAAIVERPLPVAWIRLNEDRALSTQDVEQVAASTAKLSSLFQPRSRPEIRRDEAGIIDLDYEPGPLRILWAGIAANIGLWCYFALVCWTFGWFVRSFIQFFDPRRKRARKLGVHLCPRCDYDVRLIESARCPECGESLTIEPEQGKA